MIDVAANQKEVQKETKKGKPPSIDIHIEMKIIASSDDCWELWKDFISAHSAGELIDPDKNPPIKCNVAKDWSPEKEGIISREFFKWLGNFEEDDFMALLTHLLHRTKNWDYAYPKVVMKCPTSVLEECYHYKDWVERRKRKHIIRKEIQILHPKSLPFYDKNGGLNKPLWKEFKRIYHITPASMRVLLECPGEYFFVEAKQKKNKNKTMEQISPYAKEFLKVFLRRKATSACDVGRSFFRKYSSSAHVKLGEWEEDTWSTTKDKLKLAVIDFRRVPGFMTKGSTATPYYTSWFSWFANTNEPKLTEPPIWMWICGDKETQTQLIVEAEKWGMMETYAKRLCIYEPFKFERLEDRGIKDKYSKASVHLLFLLKKEIRKNYQIPDEFKAPSTPFFTQIRKYNELEYRMNDNELRMEFYLSVLELFCDPGDSVYTVHSGTKIVCAGLVS